MNHELICFRFSLDEKRWIENILWSKTGDTSKKKENFSKCTVSHFRNHALSGRSIIIYSICNQSPQFSCHFHWEVKLSSTKWPNFFLLFLDFLLVNCQTNWGFPEEWHSTWKWKFGALVHYVALTRLQSSSAGVSLGPLRVLNNASYSLSRELISSKLSNQHWRAWRALKERWVWLGSIQKEIFDLNIILEISFYI